MKKSLLVILTLGCALLAASQAQSTSARAGHVGMPIDWSSNHVVHSMVTDQEFADAVGKEPRVLLNWFRRDRIQRASAAAMRIRKLRLPPPKPTIKRDWNFSLGSGTVAPSMTPAKFGFDVNATPSCSADFAVYGLNVAGSTSGTAQPNLVAFNNLYSGTTGSSTAIVLATISGTVVTITATNTLVAGDYVSITGLTPAAYNGNYKVVSANAASFTYNVAANVGNTITLLSATYIQSGLCGTVPSVDWAYDVSTTTPLSGTGVILTSPSLSFGGTRVAFIESKVSQATISSTSFSTPNATITTTSAHGFAAGDTVIIAGVSAAGYNGTFIITAVPTATTFRYTALIGGLGAGTTGTASVPKGGSVFHVLTIGTTGSNGGWDSLNNVYTVAVPGTSNNASLSSTTISSTDSVTLSSPFIEYGGDVAYFGDDGGVVYKVNCVFLCATNGITQTVTALTTAIAGTPKLTATILDSGTEKLFFGGSNGTVYAVDLSTCSPLCTVTSSAFGAGGVNGAVFDPPTIDTTFQTVFVTTGDSGGSGAVREYNESLTTLATNSMGPARYPVGTGVLSDTYFSNTLNSTVTATNPGGSFTSCGAVAGGSGHTGVWGWAFTAGAGTLTTANPPVLAAAALGAPPLPGNTGNIPCTGLLEFKNGTDRVFFSQDSTQKCGGPPTPPNSGGDGCLWSFDLSSAAPPVAPAADNSLLVHGGASGSVGDNVSTSPQASSLYFANQALYTLNSINPCTYTSGSTASYCAIKVTQSALQ